MKLIILLREPISRAFSQYNHFVQKNNLNIELTESQFKYLINKEQNIKLQNLDSNGGYFIVRGFYDEILEYIFTKFPRENVYIGISEEIKKNKLKYYNEIYDFLGAAKLKQIKNLDRHVRKYTKKIPKSLEKYLYDIYKPHNEKLYKILGRKIDVRYYIQLESAF